MNINPGFTESPSLVKAKPLLGPLFLALLTFVVFSGYFTGESAPPWDFWGTYTAGSYTWWSMGSFFSPLKISPFMMGGFPAFLDLQSGAWFLPVGLVNSFTPYTPGSAAALQAITAAFGAVGCYILGRAFSLSRPVAVIVAIGFLFSEGFFGRAQHTDVVRAWAFFPWILFALLPRSEVKKWHIMLAILLWFQFFVGAYPGIIVATVYLGAIWVAVSLYFAASERRGYLVWLVITVIPGLFLSAVKWVPFLSAGGEPSFEGNTIVATLGILGTVLYPFQDLVLPNDITLRTFFVVPILVLAIPFITGQRRVLIYAGALLVSAFVIGVDVLGRPGFQEDLPLLDLSRTRTNDFKPGVILSTCLLGGAGIQSLVTGSFWTLTRRSRYSRSGILIFATIALILTGLLGPYSQDTIKQGLVWLAIALVTLALAMALVPLTSPFRNGGEGSLRTNVLLALPSLLLILGATGLGWSWARDSAVVWDVPKTEYELAIYGVPVSDLIDSQPELDWKRRPARSGPSFPAPSDQLLSYAWVGKQEYGYQPSLGGYVNLKGQFRYEQLLSLSDKRPAANLMSVLKKESLAWRAPKGNIQPLSSFECIRKESCLEKGLEVSRWRPDSIDIAVPPGAASRITVNELSYPGWTAISCAGTECRQVPVPDDRGAILLAADVPANTTSVHFEYAIPKMKEAWTLFVLGLLLGVGAVLIVGKGTQPKRSSRRVPFGNSKRS